jgi:transposase
MNDYSLPGDEIECLEALHRELTEKRQADRVKAIILLGSGWTPSQVAQVLLIDRSTGRRFYRQGGVKKLLATHYPPHQGYLNAQQEQELDHHLQQHLHITAKSVAAYVEERFGIRYSERGMTELLHRLGYVYKKPKTVPGKADAASQKNFLENYEKLKKNKAKEDVIMFMDAVHPQHNPVMASGWIKRGKDFQIPTNTGRKRLNINAAMDVDGFHLVVHDDQTVNAQSTIQLFKKIEAVYPDAGKITLICDNAKYYRSRELNDYLEDSKIELMFLPPYALNLNLIERLWKYFKKNVLYNHYFETFDEFKKACICFFENIDDHQDSLRSILTENFQIIEGKMGYS